MAIKIFSNSPWQIGRIEIESLLLMSKILIGVMGPGDSATPLDLQSAYQLGQLIAQAGWVLLTSGKNVGVMDAASRGAKAANGLTVGILPDADVSQISSAIDIAIATDLGSARIETISTPNRTFFGKIFKIQFVYRLTVFYGEPDYISSQRFREV
jgi:predicted Rossmann-fold nucleotide-binding protein